MRTTYLIWGDRKHWEITVGRLNVSRWCSGAPCHLVMSGRHRLHWRLWARSWSAADRQSPE